MEIKNNQSDINYNDKINECIKLSYPFEPPLINTIKLDDNTFQKIEINNLSTYQDPGNPQLPVKNVNILLPPHTIVKEIKIYTEDQEITLTHKILPCGKPMTIGDTPSNKYITQPANLYSKMECYPEKQVEQIDMQKCKGYTILLLRLFPVQYYPYQNKIIYTSNINLSIITEYKEQDHSLIRYKPEDIQCVIEKVDNPTMLNSYEYLIINKTISGFEEEFKYIIITSDSLDQYFQPLIEYKNQYITAKSIPLSYINSSFNGKDLQEKIRACIRYYYQYHNSEFVLIGGDVDVIPYRGLWGEAVDHEGMVLQDNAIPSDLYYACLDGTWDADNDSIFGEDVRNSTSEEADFFAEVYIGRAPVETRYEVEIFINKVINFETAEKPDGVVLHQSGINMENNPDSSVIPEQCAQWITENYMVLKIYQKKTNIKRYVWDQIFSGGKYIIIEHTGNGIQDRYFLSWPETYFCNIDCPLLRNQFYPIHISIACESGAFEFEDCLAEEMILNGYGGASACLFNSRRGFTSSTDAHRYSGEIIEQQFFQIFQNNITHIGKVNQYAKETYAADSLNNPAYRWCYYCVNLLGDPEMSVFGMRNSTISQSIYYVNDDFNSSTPGWNRTHFNTIQAGINAALSWDTVFVYNGIYNETITIDKKIHLTGENNTETILLNLGNNSAISIQAYHVTLSNLRILSENYYNKSTGIICKNTNWNKIFNCIIQNQSIGIYTENCQDILIANNMIELSKRGIWDNNSNAIHIINNQILKIRPDGYGIYQKNPDFLFDYYLDSNISKNIISSYSNKNKEFSCGIYSDGHFEKIIDENYINNCSIGIWCNNGSYTWIKFNKIENNSQVAIYSTESHLYIVQNIIINNGNNYNNDIKRNETGGIIHKFKNKTITNTRICYNEIINNNGYGIYLENCYFRLHIIETIFRRPDIYLNDIYGNKNDAFCKNSRCWWGNNFWGNSLNLKLIHGQHSMKSGIEIPWFFIDLYPSTFSIRHFRINNITVLISAGFSYNPDFDFGSGFTIIATYNIERKIKLQVITKRTTFSNKTYNQTSVINLDPLGIEHRHHFISYPIINPFKIYKLEIICKIDDECIAKRSGIQISSNIIILK
jgi:nitrous oxidase accessory protein NosD